MIFIGFFIVTALFLLSVWIGSPGLEKLAVFWDTPSLLLVLLGITAHILHSGRKAFTIGVRTFFAASFPSNEQTIEAGRYFQRLTEFSMGLGVVLMLLGTVVAMVDADPNTVGQWFAVALLSFTYTCSLSLFVFLPIALRLTPLQDRRSFSTWFTIRLTLFGFGAFFLMRCLIVLLITVMQMMPNGEAYGEVYGSVQPNEFGKIVHSATFELNPADIAGEFDYLSAPIYWDTPSLVLVFGSLAAILLAGGRFRGLISVPVCITVGVFWSVQGVIFMLCDLDPNTIAAGFMVAMLTSLYGFAAAGFFLVVDMVRDPRESFPSDESPSKESEQAKRIVDNAVDELKQKVK